jgi:aspartate kinase
MARILHVLSRSGASVQTIVQNTAGPDSSRSDVALILPAAQAALALAGLNAAKGTIGFQGLQHDSHVGRVSVTGLGMRSSPEIFCTFLKALSDADVELDLVDMSETCLGAVTQTDRLADAERAVRRAFGLAPAAEAAMPEVVGNVTVSVGPPVDTWAAISDHDITHVPRDGRTMARHF